MRQTIIGFFSSASDAENAAERLRQSGFAETDIDLSTGHTAGETDTPYGVSDESRYSEPGTGTNASPEPLLNEDVIRDRKGEEDTGIGDSIGRFFRNLFDNKEDAERFATAGRKNSIVSVYAETGELAEQARDILDDCGAVDIDEEETQNSGWRGNSLGSYTDTADKEELSPDVNLGRDRASADMDDKTGTPAGDYVNQDEGESESKRTRTRSRIVDRRVEENFRLRQSSGTGDFKPTDLDAEKLSGNNKTEEKI